MLGLLGIMPVIAQPTCGDYDIFLGDTNSFLQIPNNNGINIGDFYTKRTVEVWFWVDDVTSSIPQVIYEEGAQIRGINIFIKDGYAILGAYNRNTTGPPIPYDESHWAGTWFRYPIQKHTWYHGAIVLDGATNTVEDGKLTTYLKEEGGNYISKIGKGAIIGTHSGDIMIGKTTKTVMPLDSRWVNDEVSCQVGECDDETQYNLVSSVHGSNSPITFNEYPFSGKIGILRIWDEARTLTQIDQFSKTILTQSDTEGTNILGYLLGDGAHYVDNSTPPEWVYVDKNDLSTNAKPTMKTQDIDIYLNPAGKAMILPSDIDNGTYDADGIQSLSLDISRFTCDDLGSNIVTLSAIDKVGLCNEKTAIVNVRDIVKPKAKTIDITVQLDANNEAIITASDINNTSTDNCGIETYIIDRTTFDCSHVGLNNIVTLTVIDKSGNTDTKTAIVLVEDKTPPTVLANNVTIYYLITVLLLIYLYLKMCFHVLILVQIKLHLLLLTNQIIVLLQLLIFLF